MTAEKMLTQVDSYGLSLTVINEIIEKQKEKYVAIPKADTYVSTLRGQKRDR